MQDLLGFLMGAYLPYGIIYIRWALAACSLLVSKLLVSRASTWSCSFQIVPSASSDASSIARIRSLLSKANVVEVNAEQGDFAEK